MSPEQTPERSYGDFHARQGWYFRRSDSGGVVIRLGNGRDQEEVELDAATWASIVAHVSERGESSETFAAVLAFHGEGRRS